MGIEGVQCSKLVIRDQKPEDLETVVWCVQTNLQVAVWKKGWKVELKWQAEVNQTQTQANLLRRLRQENRLNPGGGGCSELRSRRTPATERDSVSKKKKEERKKEIKTISAGCSGTR
ncbi:hypothetical protein AAY473_025822, partial [Plecturocebus cupreus]